MAVNLPLAELIEAKFLLSADFLAAKPLLSYHLATHILSLAVFLADKSLLAGILAIHSSLLVGSSNIDLLVMR